MLRPISRSSSTLAATAWQTTSARTLARCASSKTSFLPQRPLQLQSSRRIPLAFQPRSFTTTTSMAESHRTESDAFGEIQVPSDKYWGAQTERSLENFRINQPQDRMPPPIVRAFGILKGAAATVNMKFGLGTYQVYKTTDSGHCLTCSRRQGWRSHSTSRS